MLMVLAFVAMACATADKEETARMRAKLDKHARPFVIVGALILLSLYLTGAPVK